MSTRDLWTLLIGFGYLKMEYRYLRTPEKSYGKVACSHSPGDIHSFLALLKPSLLISRVFFIAQEPPQPGGKGDLASVSISREH